MASRRPAVALCRASPSACHRFAASVRWDTAARTAPRVLRLIGPGQRLGVADRGGERFTRPGGELIHAEIRIDNSIVMITEDAVDEPVSSTQRLGRMVTCVIATYWQDVDAACVPR